MSYLTEYQDYIESDDELYYRLRMGYDWDDQSFQKLVGLLTNVVAEYIGSEVVPKSVVYFFANEVDRIEEFVSNELFYGNVPEPFTKESYKALISERVAVLKDMKRRFLSGEL